MTADLLIGFMIILILHHLFKDRNTFKAEENFSKAVFYSQFWLFNPIAINVSTRGNAESVVGALVLLTLYLVLVKKKMVLGGIIYGISIHFKIYPLVYSLALFLFISSENPNSKSLTVFKKLISKFTNRSSLIFTFWTIFTLIVLTIFFYWLYGWNFLYETYLYHLVRKDNRHNFSVYFYSIYLNSSNQVFSETDLFNQILNFLVDFGPQATLLLTITLIYYRDVTFAILLNTLTFVAYNKVCTVQYFSWYFSLIALSLPWIDMPKTIILILILSWVSGQAIWLGFAYKLEFLGQNTFYEIWVSGIVYFLINVLIIVSLIHYHKINKIKLD